MLTETDRARSLRGLFRRDILQPDAEEFKGNPEFEGGPGDANTFLHVVNEHLPSLTTQFFTSKRFYLHSD